MAALPLKLAPGKHRRDGCVVAVSDTVVVMSTRPLYLPSSSVPQTMFL